MLKSGAKKMQYFRRLHMGYLDTMNGLSMFDLPVLALYGYDCATHGGRSTRQAIEGLWPMTGEMPGRTMHRLFSRHGCSRASMDARVALPDHASWARRRVGGAWRLVARGFGPALWLALALNAVMAATAHSAPAPQKDEARILPDEPGKNTESLLPPIGGGEEGEDGVRLPAVPQGGPTEDFGGENVDGGAEDSLEALIEEDIPDLEVVELTPDMAKRALDAFAEVFGKFPDEEIAKYPTLQEFAKKSPEGKRFAEIIRKHGFKSVRMWNNVITNIGFAFSSIEEGHDEEIVRQIQALERRENMPKERKEKLLKYLRALIPSVHNRKVVLELLKDPQYRKKLDLLEGGGGEE